MFLVFCCGAWAFSKALILNNGLTFHLKPLILDALNPLWSTNPLEVILILTQTMRNAIIKFSNISKDNNDPENLEQTNPILIFDLFSTIFNKTKPC